MSDRARDGAEVRRGFPASLAVPDALALLALALLCGAGHLWFRAAAARDSDRHYHLAISRLASWTGRIATLPQVEDLGWGKKFPDKEWLFHLLTTWGDRAAGPLGVEIVCLLLALAAVAGLYALCRTGAGPGPAFLFTATGALANATFLFRLQMIRPQVLAIAAFLWLAVGLAQRRPRLTAAAGVVFALGYHALYVPLALLLWFAWLAFRPGRDRAALEVAAFGVGGLVAGALLNPVFPSNLDMLVVHLNMALGASSAKGSGLAMLPLTTSEFLLRYAAPLGLVGLALGRPWWAPFHDAEDRGRTVLWGGAGLFFWGLACVTPRAAEYAIPLSAAAGAHAFGRVALRWTLAVAALAVVLCLPDYAHARDETPSDRYAAAVAPAVARLPAAAAGKKVLNCAFDEGSVLLDLRPDVRVVDVLSPEFLEQSAPQLAALRRKLQDGELADAAAVVRDTFHAAYVVCGYPKAEALLNADPRFVRLSPPVGTDPPGPRHALFALSDTPVPAVARVEVLRPAGDPGAPAAVAGALSPVAGSVYFDLPRRGPPRDAKGCVQLRIPASETARFAGTALALLGGGPLLSLGLDGAPIFSSAAPLDPRWNDVLVPLPAPLAAGSQLTLRVCPSDQREASGAAISLWTWAEVEAWCARVGKPLARDAGLSGIERSTCLAPLAVGAAAPPLTAETKRPPSTTVPEGR